MQSPRLDHCPEGLPVAAYLSADWFARERRTVLARNWICAGRVADFPPGTLRAVVAGTAPVLVCRARDGAVSAFHNTCRHRGSELCAPGEGRALGRLVTCPYHAWAYDARDGRLVSTAHARPGADFRREAHGLIPVANRVWAGFLFLLTDPQPDLRPLRGDVPLELLDNWPMGSLIAGHREEVELDCNWKTFWENYSECLHCPGIHPELCDMVPVYGRGLMAPNEAVDWTPGTAAAPPLKPGAQSWTMTGAPCGPVFPGLSGAERQAGFTFVTLWPSLYVVAHADHVRAVRLEPLGPNRTRLTAEWFFAPETLAQPGFDAAGVAAFAMIVLRQDAAAAEMNQRGLGSPAARPARLMPEEYELLRFQRWVIREMEDQP
ncbi:MAG: aromatic ring-hydroxylating oxygenase subunit alpha [Pseudorhodobacter sp.]